jgi:hypothetical protein
MDLSVIEENTNIMQDNTIKNRNKLVNLVKVNIGNNIVTNNVIIFKINTLRYFFHFLFVTICNKKKLFIFKFCSALSEVQSKKIIH